MRSNRVFNRGLLIGLGGVALFLLLDAGLSYWNVRQLNEDARWVSHTHQVMDTLEEIIGHLREAEVGQRTYLLTDDAAALQPYRRGIDAARQKARLLKELTADNPDQQARLPELDRQIDELEAIWSRAATVRREQGIEAARKIAEANPAQKTAADLQELVGQMDERERSLLRERESRTESAYFRAVVTGFVAAAMALVAASLFFWLLGRYLHARHQAEQAIRESQQLFQAFMGHSPTTAFIKDAAGRYIFVNQMLEHGFDRPLAEWIGKTDRDVFPPDQAEQYRRNDREVLAARKTTQFLETATQADGLHHYLSIKFPIQDAEGNWLLAGMSIDITEQKQAEQALRESEQRLRSVLDSIPQKIFTARPNGEVDYFNPQWSEFTGLPFEEIRDWGWTRFIHPDDVAENVRAWRHAVTTGEPFQFEHRFRRADGEYRWHISRARALKDADGQTLMWIGSNTDIHEQMQTAEHLRSLTAELSESDRRKSEFLAMLAHELRNPLAPIRNGLQLLRLVGGEGATAEQARIMMERQLAQLVRLVDDLMDISRITRGRIELRKERVALGSVLQGAIETSRPLIEQMGHQLTIALPDPPLLVEADPTRLAQVFLNLLNNAAKYSERGGHIWLTAERQGSDVRVSVRDTGIGIAADQLPRVFEMFTQVDRSLERSQGGLGIGLTLVKRLVEMHGGSIEAHSDGPGKGSEFVVRLPVVAEEAGPLVAGGPDEPAAAKASLRILIVDDNRDAADSLAMMLRLMGHDTHTAYEGEQGEESAAAIRPDVALLDIGLPKRSGYEVCRHLREQSWAKEMILVAVTGWSQEEDRRRSLEAGFDHHLVKPVDPAALVKLLAELYAARK